MSEEKERIEGEATPPDEGKDTSMEPGSLAQMYAMMSMRATEEAVRVGVEAGTRAAEQRLAE